MLVITGTANSKQKHAAILLLKALFLSIARLI
jgi:hypothetical protein